MWCGVGVVLEWCGVLVLVWFWDGVVWCGIDVVWY